MNYSFSRFVNYRKDFTVHILLWIYVCVLSFEFCLVKLEPDDAKFLSKVTHKPVLCWAENEKLLSEHDWTGREPRQKSPRRCKMWADFLQRKKKINLPCAISYSYSNIPPSTLRTEPQSPTAKAVMTFPSFLTCSFVVLAHLLKQSHPEHPSLPPLLLLFLLLLFKNPEDIWGL